MGLELADWRERGIMSTANLKSKITTFLRSPKGEVTAPKCSNGFHNK